MIAGLSNFQTIRGQVVRILTLLVLVGFLCSALFGANIDYFLPGFSDLDSKLSIPVAYQFVLFSLFVIVASYTFFKKNNLVMLIVTLLLFFSAALSTYTVTLSHRVNSISSSLGLFSLNEIPFSDDVVIIKKGLGYKITNPTKSISIYTNLFLVGMSSLEINQQLVKLGECRKTSEELCTEIDV